MSKLNLPDLKKQLVDSILMKRIGLQCVFIIRRRVTSGKYLEGTTSEYYSTKPFGMPLGAATKTLGSAFLKALKKNEAVTLKTGKGEKRKVYATLSPGEFQVYTSPKTGNLWVVIGGGYSRYRELSGRSNAKIDLNWSGRMMRNLGIIPGSEQPSSIDVGFTSEDEKKKALWHNVMGAGKSRRKHIFMGLNQDEKTELEAYADEEIVKKIEKVLSKYTEVA